MSFGDALAAGLTELRGYAEERMRGTGVLMRPGDAVTDGDGNVTIPSTLIYAGKYYARYPGLAFEQNPEVGGATVVVSRIVIRIPFGPVARPNDIWRCDSDPDNPQLVGTYLRVASIDDQSQATAQRLVCEDFQIGVLPVLIEEAP